MDADDYVMGQTAHERDRLRMQAEMIAESTRRLLVEAGLKPGDRVLDIGCGLGDVSFLAAALVGASGKVVGIDRDPGQIALATTRAAERGLGNVAFRTADFREFADPEPFDAIVGRLVIVHTPDFAEALPRLARLARPGGIMAFHEYQTDGAMPLVCDPPDFVPRSIQAVADLIGRTVLAGPGCVGLATRLPAVLSRLGDARARFEQQVVIGRDANRANFAHIVATAASVAPAMAALGMIGPEGIDVAALTADAETALAGPDAVHAAVVSMPMVLAWVQLSAAS